MKTVKLFENNTYLRSCTASIVSIRGEQMSADGCERMCRIVFDRTVFFPEGGGQSCDLGTVSILSDSEHGPGADADCEHAAACGKESSEHGSDPEAGSAGRSFRVTDVQDENGTVFHTIRGSAPLPEPGDRMLLTIDWEHRFDNMQRHSGEHILSGAFYRLFGAVNKGFHMGDDYMTIDLGFDPEVQDRLGLPHYDRATWKMAEEAELEANRVIRADAPIVRTHFDTRGEAEKMPLRKKLAFDEDISIVTIGELPEPYDCVACCGTHPSSSGQIGMIKIYKIEPNKGMSRVYLECGERAFRHCQARLNDMYDIACDMSCGLDDLKEKYLIGKEKSRAVHDRLASLVKRVVSAEAASIMAQTDKVLVRSYGDLSTDDLLSIVKQLGRISKTSAARSDDSPESGPSGSAKESGTDKGPRGGSAWSGAPSLVILVNEAANTAILASPDSTCDCGKTVKEIAPAYSGKGGGKTQMARAMFGSADDLRKFTEKVIQIIDR